MATNPKNMSKNPIGLSSKHPLQLDFFETGTFRRPVKGWVHRKTVPYVILVQVVTGSYRVSCGGKKETVKAGEVLTVPAHVPVEFVHHDGPDGEMSVRWLHLRYSGFGQPDFLARYELPLKLPESDGREIGRLIKRALKIGELIEGDHQRLIGEQEVGARVLGVLCQESRIVDAAQNEDERLRRLRPLLVHIRENLSVALAVSELAKRAGYSTAQFHAVFKEAVGATPMHYVRTVRLEEAARLLAATNGKLAEIASAVGFADAFHLSHLFKAHFGVSPRQYRKGVAALHP